MSPEQALAKRVVVDHRSDIYSLGVTLYELLAKRPAFDSPDRGELLRAISEVDPESLRKVAPWVPIDLETIVHKTIEKNAADRYNTAGELATDLRRFLNDLPIAARPSSFASRTRKWARRHRELAQLLVAAIAVGFVGLILSTLLLTRAYRQSAERERRAEQNLHIAVDTIDRLLARVADDADIHGQLHHAEKTLRRCSGRLRSCAGKYE